MKRTVFVTAGGGPAGLGFAKAARMAGHNVILGDCNPYNLQRSVQQGFTGEWLPPCDDYLYLTHLKSLLVSHKADVLHVPSDAEISVINESRDKIPESVHYLWPSKETIRDCRDKLTTAHVLEMNGVACPRSVSVSAVSDVDWDFSDLGGGSVWVRARVGAGGSAAKRCSSVRDIKYWMAQYPNEQFMMAEYLNEEHTLTHTSLWKDGIPLAAQGRQRLSWELGNRTLSGVTGMTGVGKTVRDRQLAVLALKAITAVEDGRPPNGFYSVDCVRTKDGRLYVTEINAARPFTTATEFFARLGLNFADIYIRAAMGEDPVLPTERESPLPDGYLWIRGMDIEPVLIHESEL